MPLCEKNRVVIPVKGFTFSSHRSLHKTLWRSELVPNGSPWEGIDQGLKGVTLSGKSSEELVEH